jgi:hypothetical protein
VSASAAEDRRPAECSANSRTEYSTSCDAPISTVAEPPTPLQLIRHFLRSGTTTAGRGLTNLRSAPLAKRSLGYREMVAEDFQAALPILRDAEINFGAVAKPGNF